MVVAVEQENISKKLNLSRRLFVGLGILFVCSCVEHREGSRSELQSLHGDIFTLGTFSGQETIGQETLGAVAPQEGIDKNEDPLNVALSDENDFVAVSSRQTIESDAQRIALNRAIYQIIEPKELPLRPGTDFPNIVAYALKTTNPLKTTLYNRGPFSSEKRALLNCDKYLSPSKAQEAFLLEGGPKQDRFGLDPDGDGFACTWDPTPFRLARSSG